MSASRSTKGGRQALSNALGPVQLPDIGVPVQPRTVALVNSNTGTTAVFDLSEAEKRYLVVGCCLHRILTPTLRQYVKSTMQKYYDRNKKSSNHILHIQTFDDHIMDYKGHKLNYRNINNNNRYKAAENKYDYRVSNSVDFAKLFLQPFMAHMTGFDDSCDMSALLGLLCNVADFSQDVRNAASQVRSEVRNKWAHCDLSDWTQVHFLRCFQLMEMLVTSLKLPSSAEQKCVQDLRDWEQRGVQLILGQVIDKDLLRVVQQDVAEMQSNLVKYKESSDSEVEKLIEQLKSMKEVLAQTGEKLEQGQATLRRDVDTIGESVTEIEGRVTTLEDGQGQLAEQVRSLEDREANVEQEVGAVAEKVDSIDRSLTDFQQRQADVNSAVAKEQEVQDKKLQTLEKGQVKLEQRVDSVESWQQEVSESLAKLQVIEDGEARKPAAGLFKIPDRNKWFSGRQKELADLDAKFNIFEQDSISHKKLAICGLGGCGKTSLAIEYSWRLQETYQGGIYWMSAENNRTLEISLNDIALGIGTVGSNFDDTLARTTAWMSSLQEPWLLIVDNMDEFDVSSEVQKLLEGHWKQNSKGHILITTRREAVEMVETMGFERGNCVELTSMSEDESCAFLTKRTKQQQQPGIKELARELGGLPLALEQAAAHINVLECAFEDYLKQYKQQKLKLLKRRKVKAATSNTDKDRLAVHTTWELNFQHIQKCEDPKLAEAACAMMNIAAYLDPDDIPVELVNKGDPCVSQSPLAEYAESPLGSKEIFEVLTQFSLLQRYGKNSWSVHRLVQEVIISRCSGDDERVGYLQSACRMLHFSFSNTSSPQDILQQRNKEPSSGKLLLWGKLARHACAVWRNMTAKLSSKQLVSRLMLAKEAAAVTHEASVYLSLNKQHTEATQAQTQTLECVANTEVTDNFMMYITSVHVPLKEEYQKMLHAEMSIKDSEDHAKADVKELRNCQGKEDSESLRLQGNDLFKNKKYSEAITCYTRAINISGDNTDERLYSNRSLCYWKLDQYKLSLEDADKCIELNSKSGKGYCRRAFALAELVKKDPTYCHYSGSAKAAAALAIHHEPGWRSDAQIKEYFPNLNIIEISSAQELMLRISMMQDCTILLKEGDYSLDLLLITANIQIVAVKRHTTLSCKTTIFCSPPLFGHPVHCHFENLQFPQMSGAMAVHNGSVATLYRCQASNGFRGCKDFPNCWGGPGCTNLTSSSCAETVVEMKAFETVRGKAGYAGLQVARGTLYVDHCSIIDCGGGGLLVHGEDSHAVVTNCEVMKHIQSGLEVRNGGTLTATGNKIHSNRMHGVTVGPGASTTHVTRNHIHNNLAEGVIVLQSSALTCTIQANRIEHNGASGISVDSSTIELHDNEIANNWHWGLFLKTHSTANICRNLVHSNKCGGLWFGFNQFGRVLIDENVIRDHTGPAVHIIKNLNKATTEKMLKLLPKEKGEPFTMPPIITDRNVCQRNDTGQQQHPSAAITCLPVGCAFCGDQHKETMSCGKCRKAWYCSKDCQLQHWQRHKIICKIIQGDYSFRVSTEDMANARTFRMFNPELKGIGQGTPPDKTGRRRFIVKIQSGPEYQKYNPDSKLSLYDQTTTLQLFFRNSQLYHIIMECGVLGKNHISSKKIFCYAKMENNGKFVRIYTDHLAPLQEW